MAAVLVTGCGSDYHEAVWSQRFNSFSESCGTDVAIDPEGNIVVIGSYEGFLSVGGEELPRANGSAQFVAKYVRQTSSKLPIQFPLLGGRGCSSALNGETNPSNFAYLYDRLAMAEKVHLIRVAGAIVRQGLALPHTGTEHQICTLTGAFYKIALGHDLGNSSIARHLLP